MAESQTDQTATQADVLESRILAGHPEEQLVVEDNNEDNIVYPSGPKLWMSIISACFSMTFVGLDLTIVAVAVPSLTNQFNTVEDIGWYSAAYMVISSCFTFLYAQLYTIFSVKRLYLMSMCIFQLGSLVCTFAPTSAVFILGRAIAGLGSCGLNLGTFIIITASFPSHKRPLWTGIASGINGTAMVLAPLVGGALIDAFSWRACFGINPPLGVLTFVLTAYSFHNPSESPHAHLSFYEKVKKLDLLGTTFFVPGIVCLLIGLQWGGIKYGWNNPIIITLIVLFAVLVSIFSYIQYKKQDKATLPPRLLKQRSLLAAAWFSACCNGILAVTEYYLAIYFQGVRGFSATKSGALGLPLMAGLSVASVIASILVSVIGYYYPFMFATSIIAPIAAGLLTTLNIDESMVKVLCLVGVLGIAVGLGIASPILAVQTVLPLKDISTGLAITGFAGGLGSCFFISVSSTLFQNRLAEEVAKYAPGTNTTAFEHGGLANVRDYIGTDRLRDVLLGYDKAVMQTLYLPVALAALTIVGSVAMERKSVKKKQS